MKVGKVDHTRRERVYLRIEHHALRVKVVTQLKFEVCHVTRAKHVTREPLLEAAVEPTVAVGGVGRTLAGHGWRRNRSN